MKNLIFLCVASCIFILSVIVLNYAPTITGLVGKGTYRSNGDVSYSYGWADFPCRSYSDLYNDYEDQPVTNWKDKENKEYHLDLLKEGKNNCLRKKAMIGLEYSAFNLDVIFGFICAILGMLLYSGIKVGKIAGLIALGSGAIGFVLTLVYVIYSGIVFNNDVIDKIFDPSRTGDINPYPTTIDYLATTSDGAYYEWKDNKYVCIFYDKDNKDKLYRKYSNYGSKYLNYYYLDSKKKDEEYYKYQSFDIYNHATKSGLSGCLVNNIVTWKNCKNIEEQQGSPNNKYKIYDEDGKEKGECDKLYLDDARGDDVRKNLYNSWVTTIVFGCFIFVLDAVLAVFGFLVYKDSSGTSGAI